MSKLLIDTNIALDLLAKREPFYKSAAQVFSLADKHKLKLSVSSLTFANTNCILTRLKSAKEAREILRKFKILVKILSLNEKIVGLALNDEDFKDFKQVKIPVMTAEEYLISKEKAQSS